MSVDFFEDHIQGDLRWIRKGRLLLESTRERNPWAVGDLPRGTVTLLFTDLEGSTRLLHELGPERSGDPFDRTSWSQRRWRTP